MLYQSIIIFDCHISQFWDLEKQNNTTLVQSDSDQFVSPYQHRGTFTTSRRMKVPSTNTLNDKSIPYHSGNTWAIIYIRRTAGLDLLHVGNSWWNTQLMIQWRTLSEAPESQFFNSSLLTVIKHTFQFKSFRDNPLKHFISTLCATFTLSKCIYMSRLVVNTSCNFYFHLHIYV